MILTLLRISKVSGPLQFVLTSVAQSTWADAAPPNRGEKTIFSFLIQPGCSSSCPAEITKPVEDEPAVVLPTAEAHWCNANGSLAHPAWQPRSWGSASPLAPGEGRKGSTTSCYCPAGPRGAECYLRHPLTLQPAPGAERTPQTGRGCELPGLRGRELSRRSSPSSHTAVCQSESPGAGRV